MVDCVEAGSDTMSLPGEILGNPEISMVKSTEILGIPAELHDAVSSFSAYG